MELCAPFLGGSIFLRAFIDPRLAHTRLLTFAPMNSGKMNQTAIRLIFWSLAGLVGFYAAAWIGRTLGTFILLYWQMFLIVWVLFIVAIVYLSRDPDPIEPNDINALVAPAHGTVDVIDEQTEVEFVNAPCQRVSIRTSIIDVQVQYAPTAVRVACIAHSKPIRLGGNSPLEMLLLGLEPIMHPQQKLALRMVGSAWGRQIVPWVAAGDVPARSARLGMMRLGNRVDIFLPRTARLTVHVGDKVVGGQSVLARWE